MKRAPSICHLPKLLELDEKEASEASRKCWIQTVKASGVHLKLHFQAIPLISRYWMKDLLTVDRWESSIKVKHHHFCNSSIAFYLFLLLLSFINLLNVSFFFQNFLAWNLIKTKFHWKIKKKNCECSFKSFMLFFFHSLRENEMNILWNWMKNCSTK